MMQEYAITNQTDRVRVRWFEDSEYQPDYGLDTPEETAAAIAEEWAALESGTLVALYAIVERRDTPDCPWVEHDSLHGIVVDTSDSLEALAPELLCIPTPHEPERKEGDQNRTRVHRFWDSVAVSLGGQTHYLTPALARQLSEELARFATDIRWHSFTDSKAGTIQLQGEE